MATGGVAGGVRHVVGRGLAAGGSVVQAMEDKPDGDRRGGIADANGIVWWIATQIG